MNNVGQHLLSGGLSGFASTICLQPFDLLKTRLQQGDGASTHRTQRTPLAVPRIPQLVRDIAAADGVTGLWRGTAPSLLRNVPGVALYMSALTQLRTVMARSQHFTAVPRRDAHRSSALPTLSGAGNLLAGGTARVAVGFMLNPFSVLKARFESDIYRYAGVAQGLRALACAGRRELFRGFVPSAMRDAPYAGLFVACYEGIKRETASLLAPTSALSSTGIHTFSAAAAGAVATLVTHPFDVIKTKVQVRREDRYHGLRSAVATIWEQRGARGFFDGASLRLSRKVCSSAIGWAVYEGLLLFMARSSPRA